MAMIIRLDRVADSTQDEAIADASSRERMAEVILFPGVRYERWSDETAVSVPRNEVDRQPAPMHHRRDWLDI